MRYVFFDGKSFTLNKTKSKPHNRILLTINEYEELLEQIEFEKKLNINLKRICKERACQKAGKSKDSTGYFVIFSLQAAEKYMKDISFEQWRKENPETHSSEYRSPVQCEHKVWRTALQTPHDASMPFPIAEPLILDELYDHVFADLDIDEMLEDTKSGIYPEQTPDCSDKEKNIVYRWSFKADFKNGFWIFDCYHTKPVSVSESFRI